MVQLFRASGSEIRWFIAIAVIYPFTGLPLLLLNNPIVLFATIPYFSPLVGILSFVYGTKSRSLFLSLLVGPLSSVLTFALLLFYRPPFPGPSDFHSFAWYLAQVIVGPVVGFGLMGLDGNLRARELRREETRVGEFDLNRVWGLPTALGLVFWAIWTWRLLYLSLQS